jgi:hypothetical protein
MTSMVSPHFILLLYWLVMIVLSAFFLRMACSLCQTGMPTWRRAVVSVLVVSFLAYLTFDFTAYLIMRSLQGVVIQVPPWYGYNFWFREPIVLKWLIISQAGPLRYVPFVFGLCAAGLLQVIVLQLEVTFRWGLLIVLLQWGATAVAGYIVSLLFGVVLSGIGWTMQPDPVARVPGQAHKQPEPKQPASPKGQRVTENRDRTKEKKTAQVSRNAKTHEAPASDQVPSEPTTLQVFQREVEGATQAPREHLQSAAESLKAYADSQIDDLKEDLEPIAKHLPGPVQDFLDKGGWWAILGILGLLALFWLRLIVRKLGGAVRPRHKKKKRRKKSVAVDLREDLRGLGETYTEEGSQQLTVKGLPARLRLVILSLGTRNAGELSEEMVDRVLDWIKPGLAEVTASDYPRVRVWPAFYSRDGFALAFASNVVIPALKGEQSRWVLVSGRIRMGRAIINVGMGLYADEANTLRSLTVKREQWLSVLGVKQARQPVGAR